MLRKVRIFIPAFFLFTSSCFVTPIKSNGTLSSPNKEGHALAAPTFASAAKNITEYNPDSTTATELRGPSGNLSGSSISLPPGSLSISTSIVVEESIPLSETSIAGSLGLRSDLEITPVGAGLIIRPTSEVNLTKPLQISMPLSIGGGLREMIDRTLALGATKNYAVFYKYFFEGQLRAGVIPASQLTFNDNNQLTWEGYFGAYWLCETNFAIEAKTEVETTEPLVNYSHVAVIESAGFVPEELIAAKAIIPEEKWASIALDVDSVNRSFILKGRVYNDPKVNGCFADILDNESALKPVSVGGSLIYNFVPGDTLSHAIKGRLRCMDAEGRLTTSPWSDAAKLDARVDVIAPPPFLAIPPPYFSQKEGAYASNFLLTIQSPDADAKIYFTLDGSVPTTKSSLYQDPIYISHAITLKAIAAKIGFANSEVSSANFTMVTATGVTAPAIGQTFAPTFSPPPGIFSGTQAVTLSSATSGTTIRYTLDGSTPNSSSLIYSAALSLSTTTTIRAIAAKPGMSDSSASVAVYTFSTTADTLPPTLQALFMSNSVVNTETASQTIYLDISVADNVGLPSNLANFQINFQPASGGTQTLTFTGYPSDALAGGTSTARSFHSSATMPLGSANGIWNVQFLFLRDELNNTVTLYPSDLTALGMNVQIVNNAATADSTAPLLTALSLSTSTVNTMTSQNISLDLSFTDNFALSNTVTNYQVTMGPSTGSQSITFSNGPGDALAGATSTARSFHANSTLPAGSAIGTWGVQFVFLRDNLGNTVTLYPADLIALGMNVSFTNTASSADSTPPTLQALTPSTTSINTASASQTVYFDITVADNFALPDGTSNYQLNLQAPLGSQSLFIYSYANEALAGATSTLRSFHGSGIFPQGSTPGLWTIQFLYLRDNLGNTITLYPSDLTNLGFNFTISNMAP